MNILALDTSTDYLTIAVMKDDEVIGRFHVRVGRNHSMLVIPTIGKLLRKCRLKPADIGYIAIGVGPGSFTGLRIGVATVKGLSYALKIPIVAVPTFDAIAENCRRFESTICVVLDARKNKVYGCIYSSDGKTIKRLTKYLLIPASELAEKLKRYDNILFLGDGVHLLGANPGLKNWYPKAGAIAGLGVGLIRKRKFVSREDLEPMYIYSRECDIKGI